MDELEYFLEMMRPFPWEKYIPRIRGKVEPIMPGIRVISVPQPFYIPTNCYLVEGDERTLLDPGHAFPASVASLLAGLDAAGYAPADIDLVAATHPHVDHASAMVKIDALFSCRKGMNQEAFARVRDYGAYLRWFKQEYARRKEHIPVLGVPQAEVETFPQIYYLSEGPIALDTPFVDGGLVRFGSRDWRVMHTPGHCPFHLAFLQEQEGILLSGDLFIGKATSLGDIGDYLATLDKLEQIDAKIVLPAHGPPLKDLPEQVRVARQTIEARLNSAMQGFQKQPLSIGELGLSLFGPVKEIPLASTAVGMCLAIVDYCLCRGMIREIEPTGPVAPVRYAAS